MDSVETLLARFDGSEQNEINLRRALLRATRHIDPESPLRPQIDEFVGDIQIVALSVRIGGELSLARNWLLRKWDELAVLVQSVTVH